MEGFAMSPDRTLRLGNGPKSGPCDVDRAPLADLSEKMTRRSLDPWTERYPQGSVEEPQGSMIDKSPSFFKPASTRPRRRRRLELGKTLFLLPNLITISSIFCGFDAIRLAARGGEDDIYRAAVLLIFAMIFDMLDGRVARMTKTQSAFGVQIDSLADVISFGIAPSLLVYQWTSPHHANAALFASFLFTASGAVRLARFNVLATNESGAPTKPGKYIVGLPIPGAAGILISLVVANHAIDGRLSTEPWSWPILGVTVLLSMLMVSTVHFRSFKDLKLNARTIGVVAFAVGSSGLIYARLKPAFVLVWLLSFYVILGLFEALWQLSRGKRPSRDSAPPPGI
jgi:CDP-diacylglycerol---serine O-phosphatidyltransferase